MSLNDLSFVSKSRPASASASVDPTAKARKKMITSLDQQIAAYGLHKDGKRLTRTVKRDGEEKQVLVSHWFWKDGDDEYIGVKYGNRKLPVSGKNSTIQVGEALGVVATLELIKTAVEEGDLDKSMMKIVNEMSAARVGK